MRCHEREEQVLSHIKAMIRELERLGHRNGVQQTSVVMEPDYWRMRIHTVLAATDLPHSVVEQASQMLTMLDSLAATWDRQEEPTRRLAG